MSTRANLIIRDGISSSAIQLYRHSDGYPKAVLPDLEEVFAFTWTLPRFEADDFAAAIIRAWKERGGGMRIDGNYQEFPDGSTTLHGDIEWLYEITARGEKLCVLVTPMYEPSKRFEFSATPEKWAEAVAVFTLDNGPKL